MMLCHPGNQCCDHLDAKLMAVCLRPGGCEVKRLGAILPGLVRLPRLLYFAAVPG